MISVVGAGKQARELSAGSRPQMPDAQSELFTHRVPSGYGPAAWLLISAIWRCCEA